MARREGEDTTMSTINLTKTTFDGVMKKEGLVLIDWWASWCGPCKAFAPVYEQVSKSHPEAVFAKVDTQAEAGLAAAFEVRAIPTLSVLRDGVLLFHRAGMIPAKALDDLIKQAAALDMNEVNREIASAQAKPAAMTT
jgi:thioredoxin 1